MNDVMARRRDGGQPLREAMKTARLTYHRLAAETRRVAAEQDKGSGISMQMIAFLATAASYARETTSARSAELIEDALGVKRSTLFEYVTTTPGGNSDRPGSD